MKKFFLIVFSIIVYSGIAQMPNGTYKDYFREGSFLTLEENYDLALKNFVRAYELDSSSANINYNLGVCYLKSYSQKIKAEYYLSKAITNIVKTYKMDDPNEKAAPPLTFFYYAQALHINYKFDEAIAQYDKFAAYIPADKQWVKDLAYYRKQSEYAKELVAIPMNVQISNLGDSINSEYPDFSPVLSADERMLIFTTRRPTSTGAERTPDGQYFEDIVVSYKDNEGRWSKPVPLSEFVNTNGHEASINLTPDGQTLIVYRDDGGNGNIYFSQWDGKTWSSLQQFGSDINTKYWESHACLNSDGTILYFVSDRPGGKGGKDIYRCIKLPNGKWSKALNVGGTVNTEYDEDGAFIHPDGRSFFFASKGHKSMGGFDMMFSILDDENKFSDPINLGSPINTPDDDVYLVVSPDGKRSYYSSAKEGGMGDKDIYMISIPGAAEKPLALFKGQIIPAEGEKLPDDLMIVVHDKLNGEIVGSYRPKINGTFTTILPPGKEYNFSYQSHGEEFYNEDIYVTNELAYQEIKKEISLEPVSIHGAVKVKNKGIILNVVVLNNPKDKKVVPGAQITLTEKSGPTQNFTADEHGKKEGTVISGEKNYTILAESAGKKSVVSNFSTAGIKGSKTITELIYLDGKTKSSLYSLSLNVVVYNNAKQKKVIANANVVLMGNDGSKFEGQTDEKGQLKDIGLDTDVNYDLSATKDDATTEKTYFTTNNTKANKVYNKVLFIENPNAIAKLPPSKYQFFFKYNMNKIDEAEDIWVSFIDRVVALSKKKTVNISINASASKVPSIREFKGNPALAASRALVTQEKIKAAVEAKGGDVSKLKFSKSSSVGGPPWKNDHELRKAEFEKYQFVKVSAN